MSAVGYEVKTPVFEGPLDLLLQLITQRRLEVTELSLSDLVSQYLAHLDLMRSLDLEVTSEFLLIAATLIQMKARYLLPGDSVVDLDEDLLLAEERDRLLSRLLANLTFKDVAAVLGHRLETNDLLVPRLAGLDDDLAPPPAEVRLGVDLETFTRIASRVITAGGEPRLDHLDLDLPSVSAAIRDLRTRVREGLETDFDRITAHVGSTRELVAYFLAMLELARWGMVTVRQDEAGPIKLTGTSADDASLVSEWDA